MSVSREHILERLRRVKGPDLESNIVDLGLVSEVLVKDGRVSFSITVPAKRGAELEPLRQAAEKIVREIDGVSQWRPQPAERTRGATRRPRTPDPPEPARARGPRQGHRPWAAAGGVGCTAGACHGQGRRRPAFDRGGLGQRRRR
jgi:ATP-binding protein involved in chromosome partitioning